MRQVAVIEGEMFPRGSTHYNFRHGGAVRTATLPLYRAWKAMRNRCNNPNGQDWRYYGGKGVTICSRWDEFALFAADVGPHPGSGWTLDRIDGAGNYEPSNVRWARQKTQNQNRVSNQLNQQLAVEIRDIYSQGKLSQGQLAVLFGVSKNAICKLVRGVTWA